MRSIEVTPAAGVHSCGMFARVARPWNAASALSRSSVTRSRIGRRCNAIEVAAIPETPNIIRTIFCPATRQHPRCSRTPWPRFQPSRGYHLRHTRHFSAIGAEPGIDARSETATHQAEPDSEIKIIDFSSKQVVEQDVPSGKLQSVLQDQPRPEWAACRWIYVNGLNRDVVRLLGEHKQLHRLSMEDVMDTNTPTKVDWYDSHCFLELTMQKLVHLDGHAQHTPDSFVDTTNLLDDSESHTRTKQRTLAHRKYAITVEQVSIVLTSDNTVITFFERSGADVLKPLMNRLNSPRTIIRSGNDASMLVQAVIDVVVDMSVPINKAVGEMFGKLETAVLSRPTIVLSKHLYVLRSALAVLMDNMIATRGLVRTLIDHRAVPQTGGAEQDLSPGNLPPVKASTSVHVSSTAQVYLQDVQDHITALSNSTQNSIRATENLTSLIFNTIAASQNESVRQLTLISSFFLPLTFLTGYFGMNFEVMPAVNNHSDLTFWVIAVPVMSLTAILLLGARVIRLRPPRFWRNRGQHRD